MASLLSSQKVGKSLHVGGNYSVRQHAASLAVQDALLVGSLQFKAACAASCSGALRDTHAAAEVWSG